MKSKHVTKIIPVRRHMVGANTIDGSSNAVDSTATPPYFKNCGEVRVAKILRRQKHYGGQGMAEDKRRGAEDAKKRREEDGAKIFNRRTYPVGHHRGNEEGRQGGLREGLRLRLRGPTLLLLRLA
jgi:hypothetical protein